MPQNRLSVLLGSGQSASCSICVVVSRSLDWPNGGGCHAADHARVGVLGSGQPASSDSLSQNQVVVVRLAPLLLSPSQLMAVLACFFHYVNCISPF